PAVTRTTQLELLARLGFRRISMGVQDLDEDVQRAIARIQTEEETRAAVDGARSLGLRSVNLDLIYGLPRQTPPSWRRTIERIAAIPPHRISPFSFAYVPTVKPHQRRLPVAELPTGAAKLALFRLAHDALIDAGYVAIGMDHFALPDDELARARAEGRLWRDFQGYSAGRGGAGTIALGVSGIGDVGGAYLQNPKTPPRHSAMPGAGLLPGERGWERRPRQARPRRRAGAGEHRQPHLPPPRAARGRRARRICPRARAPARARGRRSVRHRRRRHPAHSARSGLRPQRGDGVRRVSRARGRPPTRFLEDGVMIELRCYEYVTASYERVCALLDGDAAGLFQRATRAA